MQNTTDGLQMFIKYWKHSKQEADKLDFEFTSNRLKNSIIFMAKLYYKHARALTYIYRDIYNIVARKLYEGVKKRATICICVSVYLSFCLSVFLYFWVSSLLGPSVSLCLFWKLLYNKLKKILRKDLIPLGPQGY